MAQLTSADMNNLPDSDFAYIEAGGSKDNEGKTTPRSLRHFPIHDAAHVRAALARAPQSPFGEKAMSKIMAAAGKFGITVSGASAIPEYLIPERRFTPRAAEVRETEAGQLNRGQRAGFPKTSRQPRGGVGGRTPPAV